MKRYTFRGVTQFLAFGFTVTLMSACGSSGGGVGNLQSLSDLPDSSALVATSGSSNAATFTAAVSGASNAPKLSAIASLSATERDELFWDNVIAEINNAETVTNAQCQADPLWGGRSDGDAAGMSGCFMTEVVFRAFEPVVRSGGSVCYMKNLPTAESGVTISSGYDGEPAELFNQPEDDRHVRVNVTGGEEGGEIVNIIVKGSNSVGSDKYHVDLYFCSENSGTPRGVEQIRVNKGSGEISSFNVNDDQYGTNRSRIIGYLKQSGDSIGFDPSRDKSANVSHDYEEEGRSGKFKASITISDGSLSVKTLDETVEGGGETWNRSQHALAQYSGNAIKDIKFLQGAFTEKSSCDDSEGGNCPDFGGEEEHSYSAALEFRDTTYVSAPDNALLDDLSDLSDDFYSSSLNVKTTELADYDCSKSPDVTVEMDFDDSAVDAIRQECDGKNFDNGNSYCWTSDFQEAEDHYWNACFN